jgi:5-methyltetrahydrofolate--homocysteine methyltransferase
MTVPILEDLKSAVIEGRRRDALELTKRAIGEGVPGKDIIEKGLIPGIRIVGELFSRGEYYLPELLVSGKSMQAALDVVEPLLAGAGEAFRVGNFLIGTVQGDIHDIGKNVVVMMLKGNGWNVTDLGVDVSPEAFCDAVRQGGYDVVGISTLLTVTMPAADQTIQALKEAGLRDSVRVMIGGAPVTREFAEKIGADECARDAWEAVEKARQLVEGTR